MGMQLTLLALVETCSSENDEKGHPTYLFLVESSAVKRASIVHQCISKAIQGFDFLTVKRHAPEVIERLFIPDAASLPQSGMAVFLYISPIWSTSANAPYNGEKKPVYTLGRDC